jgi:hypothetical protein
MKEIWENFEKIDNFPHNKQINCVKDDNLNNTTENSNYDPYELIEQILNVF